MATWIAIAIGLVSIGMAVAYMAWLIKGARKDTRRLIERFDRRDSGLRGARAGTGKAHMAHITTQTDATLAQITDAISIEPYYQDDTGVLYCGDCLEVMSGMQDESVDLVVTSPPYNLGSNHHTGDIRHEPYPDDRDEREYQEWQVCLF